MQRRQPRGVLAQDRAGREFAGHRRGEPVQGPRLAYDEHAVRGQVGRDGDGPVPGLGDPGGAMHVQSGVILSRAGWFACVQAHPYREQTVFRPRVAGDFFLRAHRRSNAISRAAECDEKSVPVGVDFITIVLGQNGAQNGFVFRKQV